MSGNWEGSNRKQRLPAEWKRQIRPRILKRDGYLCYVCGKPGADEVDHIQPGDDHSDSNLAAIHSVPCHRAKTSREGNRSERRQLMRRTPEQHPGLA